MKRPAFARALSEQIAAGRPVPLVVLSIHDWSAGKMMADRPGVVRLVVAPEVAVAESDLSLLMGLDVLIVGGADADNADFHAAQRLALAAGAASVWAEYDYGLWRVEPCGRSVMALEEVAHIDALLDRLPAVRVAHLLTGHGPFNGKMFREARLAAFGSVFGAEVVDRLRARYSDQVAA